MAKIEENKAIIPAIKMAAAILLNSNEDIIKRISSYLDNIKAIFYIISYLYTAYRNNLNRHIIRVKPLLKKNTPLILIPARMDATRLPGKPLEKIGQMPMIHHVYQKAHQANIGPVCVATPDGQIKDYLTQHDIPVILTSLDHQSGTDRIAEAADLIDPDKQHDIIINLQGDLPFIPSSYIQKVLLPLEKHNYDIGTLAAAFTEKDTALTPSVVKIALDYHPDASVAKALYFSRQPIPYTQTKDMPFYYHIGVYAYRRKALEKFVQMPACFLEHHEKLEQLRALTYGDSIGVAFVNHPPLSIDTPEDLQKARDLYIQNAESL